MGEGRLVAGLGCTRAATAAEIVALVEAAIGMMGADRGALVCVATTVRRRDHAGLRAAAERLGVPLRCLDDAALAAQEGRLANPSAVVAGHTGLGGIAEAAALAAGALVLGKQVRGGVTCALAQVDAGFDVEGFGVPA